MSQSIPKCAADCMMQLGHPVQGNCPGGKMKVVLIVVAFIQDLIYL